MIIADICITNYYKINIILMKDLEYMQNNNNQNAHFNSYL